MADYNTLTLPQKIEAAVPGALQQYNVNNPPTTTDDRDNLNRGIGAIDLGINVLRQQANLVGYDTPINVSENPELGAALKPYIPPGYTVTTITLNELINVSEGVKQEFVRIENRLSTGTPTIASGLVTPAVTPTRIVESPATTTNPSNTRTESSTGKILKAAATVAVVAGAASVISDLLRQPKSKKEVTEDPIAADLQAKNKALAEAEARGPDTLTNTNAGLPGQVNDTRAQATLQDTTNFEQKADWRVRLSLSPGAYYLYKDESNELLAPLRSTDGIVFPYTPSVNITYGANYQSVAPVHSNYKIFQYENSYVDSVSITCDFTAQDTEQARYVLAVIHFLRSVTKMFYGQDFDPKPGTPPPLCYLFGLGEFQFNAHPLAITNFTYSLPTDVDYIRAGSLTEEAGQSRAQTADITKPTNVSIGSMLKNMATDRLGQGIASVGSALGLRLQPGGTSQGYIFGSSNRFNSPVPPGTVEPTYVPTKININITAIPIVSRYEISNNFSVKDYANGSLLQGVKRAGGGFW